MIVVDASLMIAWLLKEPEFAPAVDIFDLLAEESMAVPSHWSVEIANALSVNVRRGRIPPEKLDAMVGELAALNVIAEPAISITDIGALVHFALNEKLTVYDAAYLQLAARLGAPLATVDDDLRIAAKRIRVALLPR